MTAVGKVLSEAISLCAWRMQPRCAN